MAGLVYEKYFDKDTPLDTVNEYNRIDVIETAQFSSLKEGTGDSETDLVPGILSGIGCNDLGHSKERFHDIKLASGVIRAYSIMEIQEEA